MLTRCLLNKKPFRLSLIFSRNRKGRFFGYRTHNTQMLQTRLTLHILKFVRSNTANFSTKTNHTTSTATNANSIAESSRDVSFSGSGFLCIYHFGVASALIKRNILTDKSRFAGASGGALVAAALACNVPIEKAVSAMLEIASDCRKYGTIGRAGVPLMKALDGVINEDSVSMCKNRIKIAVTQVWPSLQSPVLVEDFTDREDLLLALKSSCFIPFYLGHNFSVQWRQGRFVDGGFVEMIPLVPSYAMVLVFEPNLLPLPNAVKKSKDLISPALTKNFPFRMGELLRRAFLPASENELLDLFAWGEKAGHIWADQQDAASICNSRSQLQEMIIEGR